jgi:hypothetical protein
MFVHSDLRKFPRPALAYLMTNSPTTVANRMKIKTVLITLMKPALSDSNLSLPSWLAVSDRHSSITVEPQILPIVLTDWFRLNMLPSLSIETSSHPENPCLPLLPILSNLTSKLHTIFASKLLTFPVKLLIIVFSAVLLSQLLLFLMWSPVKNLSSSSQKSSNGLGKPKKLPSQLRSRLGLLILCANSSR